MFTFIQIFAETMYKLEIRNSPDVVTTYEVYTTIKEIKKLKKNVPKELVFSVVSLDSRPRRERRPGIPCMRMCEIIDGNFIIQIVKKRTRLQYV